MEALLDHLHAEYGSVEAYLRRLGADDELFAALRAALLEQAEPSET
jgi:hypothetical protein